MEIFKEFWAIILAGVGLVAWSIRLESQTKANTLEISRIWKQRSEDLAAQRAAREETNEMLAEVRADIKELLRKVGS
jgi:hypothetical protein